MIKGENMRKKILILVIVLGLLFSLFFLYQKKELSFDEQLEAFGYLPDEILIIVDKVLESDYDVVLELGYDESLIDILEDSSFDENNFKTYIQYYMRNKDAEISDIIAVVNSGYDLLDYPVSSLLASLVLEKYYIQDNVARYLDYGNSHDSSAKEIISMVNAKADLEFYSVSFESNLETNNLVLVNKFYYLAEDYVPDDLVSLSGDYNKGTNNKLRSEAALAFMEMCDAAKLDNIIIYNLSAYRSYDYQVNLYNKYVERDGDEADIYSARPGFSEHQTGLCLDLNLIDSSFEGTDEALWLQDNAYKYGFILRFPKGKEDITGYKYEPWHYRYVGKEAAKIIYEDDITLEEYYEYYIEKGL